MSKYNAKDYIDILNMDKSTITYDDYVNFYFDELMGKAISMYEWVGLPDTVDVRFLEYILINHGYGVFFEDGIADEKYLVFMQCVRTGTPNIYNNPKDYKAFAVNGINRDLNSTNSVLCFNSFLKSGISNRLRAYAEELAQIKMTQFINREHQKMPFFFAIDENQKLSVSNIIQKIKGFAYYVVGSKKMARPEVLNTNAPFVIDKLDQDFINQYNKALNFLGIETENPKKERVGTDEQKSTLGDVESQRYLFLNARRECAKRLNAMYGYDVKVQFRSNTTELDTATTEEYQNKIILDDEEKGGDVSE